MTEDTQSKQTQPAGPPPPPPLLNIGINDYGDPVEWDYRSWLDRIFDLFDRRK